jgi:N-acetylglucosamine-6-sulfatase
VRVAGLAAVALALVAAATACGADTAEDTTVESAPIDRPPSIVLVVTDDQRWDSIDEMPLVDGRDDWARFDTMYVHEPQCCPSRASILTGRYSHSTGVETLGDGEDLDESVTVATLLDGAGYRTAFLGKYLNGYPFGRGHYVPPGWDDFQAYEGGTLYYDYDLNENGTLVHHGTAPEDYSTDLFARRAVDIIRETPPSEPLFLYVAPNAPHDIEGGWPAQPAARHAQSCADDVEHLPSFGATDPGGEPAWMDAAEAYTAEDVDWRVQAACAAMLSVDEAVIAILDELEATGRGDDTYVVFTSDNGYSYGEHRLLGKGHLYDESARVPLLVHGPDVEPGPVDRLTSNIDLTPTMLDWAGVDAPEGFLDGSSFAAALRRDDASEGPTAILLRGCRTGRDTEAQCGGYREDMGVSWGLRTASHKYVEYADGALQLFDLRVDPYERTNLANDPAHGAVVAELQAVLDEMRDG